MATFNPEVSPINDPNYFRYSEPIRGVEPNKSTGIALTTAANAVEGGASLAKQTAEQYIKEDVRKTVEPIRSQFTADLEATKAALIPNAVQTSAGATAGAMDLTADTSTAVPDAVKSGVAKLESIKSAFVNGHVNDTYYHMQLDKGVTALRSKYPGFVDFIDEQVSKITGVIPANAVIADLMQDINRAATNKKTEQDKVLDLARGAMTKGFDKANLMYQKLQQEGESFAPKFLEWYTGENKKFTDLEYQNLQLGNLKGTKEFVAGQQKQGLNDFVASRIDSDLNATLKLTGMDKPEAISDILTKAAENPGLYSGAQLEEFATKIQAHRGAMRNQLVSLINKNPNYKYVEQTDRDALVDSQLKLYDTIYDSLRKGDASGAGLAFYQMHQSRANFDERKYKLSTGEYGQMLDNFKIVSDSLGPAFSAALAPALIAQGVPQNLAPLLQGKKLGAMAPPANPANPPSIVADMQDAERRNMDPKTEKPYYFKELVNLSDSLKDPKFVAAHPNIAQYLFGPKSTSVLDHFAMDSKTIKDINGRLTIQEAPGKHAVWEQMTDPKVTDNISKLDAKDKQTYLNWVKITGRELFGQDVKTLNHFTGHDDVKFEWDSETKQLTPVFPKNLSPERKAAVSGTGAVPLPDSGYEFQIRKVVDRVNKSLPNLEHVFKSLGGGNTEAMLLETLQQYGMDFEGKVTGLPKAFGDAIAASRKPRKTSDEK